MPSKIRKQDIRRVATAHDGGPGTSAAIPSLKGDVVRARLALQKLLGEVRVSAEGGEVYPEVETRADRVLLEAMGAGVSNFGCRGQIDRHDARSESAPLRDPVHNRAFIQSPCPRAVVATGAP
jgi:hypothetical protein